MTIHLSMLMRKTREQGQPVSGNLEAELLRVMKSDLMNYEAERTSSWKEMEDAIALLQSNAEAFLKTYFLPTPDQNSKGIFSVTSP